MAGGAQPRPAAPPGPARCAEPRRYGMPKLGNPAPVRRAAGRGVAEFLEGFVRNLMRAAGLPYRRQRMNEDPEKRREREFDIITFVLAGMLSAVVLGAVGYGILKSSK